jgi:hypothetical protein
MLQTKSLDLFAGISVTDYTAALNWYERLLGSPPAFFPYDTEAVWDLDALVAQIAARELESIKRETYPNGVRKITYRDADGNEIGLGGAPG